jgi:hypothetical protein
MNNTVIQNMIDFQLERYDTFPEGHPMRDTILDFVDEMEAMLKEVFHSKL